MRIIGSKSRLAFTCLAMLVAQNITAAFVHQVPAKKDLVPAFSFAGIKYFHRFTTGDQREYTPEGQDDLKSWTEMVTLLSYKQVKDGEGLASTASAVLENYKANKALVIKTDSVPRTLSKPAEHLIVVIFGRPEFIEAVFARFRMHDGVGTAVVFSHRIYGGSLGEAMKAWLAKNGASTEATLMKWDAMPK